MILSSLRATAVLLLLCCVAYPAVVTGVAQVAFPYAANGSILEGGVGSERIGQAFTQPAYLQGRPSAVGYDASTSSGSNYGVSSEKLAERRAADRVRLATETGGAEVPEVLLAASASGLDPDVPPEAARWQLPRIAAARGVDVARVEALLDEQVEGRTFGVFGEPHVNVLAFNLALDRRFPVR